MGGRQLLVKKNNLGQPLQSDECQLTHCSYWHIKEMNPCYLLSKVWRRGKVAEVWTHSQDKFRRINLLSLRLFSQKELSLRLSKLSLKQGLKKWKFKMYCKWWCTDTLKEKLYQYISMCPTLRYLTWEILDTSFDVSKIWSVTQMYRRCAGLESFYE